MIGFRFSEYKGDPQKDIFEHLLQLFQELLLYTNGDVDEAISWLTDSISAEK